MPFLAFPLKLEKSFLARCGERDAIIQIFEIIAKTPHGTWAGCTSFGVRDIMEKARSRREAVELATREINATLDDLGIEGYRVEKITADTSRRAETQEYSVVLRSTRFPDELISVRL
jgi:hypothetical protein